MHTYGYLATCFCFLCMNEFVLLAHIRSFMATVPITTYMMNGLIHLHILLKSIIMVVEKSYHYKNSKYYIFSKNSYLTMSMQFMRSHSIIHPVYH